MTEVSFPITVILEGEARSKSNKLFFRRGRPYIPEDIVDWENNLKTAAIKVMAGRPAINTPVKAVVRVYRSNKRKCDLGNFNKSAFDALNGIVYWDDYLICEEHMFKLFDPDRPRIEIDIYPYDFPEWDTIKELPLVLPHEQEPEESDTKSSSRKPRKSKKVSTKSTKGNKTTRKRKSKK